MAILKFLPCTCGCNRRNWRTGRFSCWYQCVRCGRIGPKAPNKASAKLFWNNMINELKEKGE